MAQRPAKHDERIQLHLVHPYNREIRDNASVKRYLAGGYRIQHLQRVTDREVLVTLTSADAPA